MRPDADRLRNPIAAGHGNKLTCRMSDLRCKPNNAHPSSKIRPFVRRLARRQRGPASSSTPLDKGFDYPEVGKLARDHGYTPHIRSRGEERAALARVPSYRSRRWVVERTHSWMSRFRRLLVRWEKKKLNFLSMIYLVCSWIAIRAADVLG